MAISQKLTPPGYCYIVILLKDITAAECFRYMNKVYQGKIDNIMFYIEDLEKTAEFNNQPRYA